MLPDGRGHKARNYARRWGLAAALPVLETRPVGGIEADGEMRHAVVVGAFEHLAMAIEPGDRGAVGEASRHIDDLSRRRERRIQPLQQTLAAATFEGREQHLVGVARR